MPERLDYILEEVREMRKEVRDGFKEQLQRLSTVETKIEPLIDNGQPGRVTKLEDKVDELQRSQSRVFGWLAGATFIIELAWHYIASFLTKAVGVPSGHLPSGR